MKNLASVLLIILFLITIGAGGIILVAGSIFLTLLPLLLPGIALFILFAMFIFYLFKQIFKLAFSCLGGMILIIIIFIILL